MYSGDFTHEYPVSSARDEPAPLTNEGSIVRGASPTSPALLRPSDAYSAQVLCEVAPGIMSDGTLTIRHPAVSKYLDRLELEFSKILDGAGPSKMNSHGSVQLGRAEDVSGMLGMELSTFQSECVLALAALRVYYNVRHPAHFALWGKSVKTRTEEVVRRIYRHTPRVISSPICWMGAKENLWLLNTQQLLAFPELSRNQPRERLQRGRMTLRQRKGRSTGAGLPNAGAIHATPQPTPLAAPIPACKEKGKLVERTSKPTPLQERPATRWFRSQRNAQEGPEGSVFMDADARGEAQQKPAPLLEVAPGVLVAGVGAGSGNGKERTEMEHPAEVEATHEEPPRTSVGMPAPTRRSSRQAIKRRAVEAAMAAVASGNGSTTPVSLPGRESSTAVSEVSERTTVGPELQGARAKKRKASEVDAEETQATEGKRKAKSRTTTGGRKRRR